MNARRVAHLGHVDEYLYICDWMVAEFQTSGTLALCYRIQENWEITLMLSKIKWNALWHSTECDVYFISSEAYLHGSLIGE